MRREFSVPERKMKYLLDTNILSELMKKRPNQRIITRLASVPTQTLFTSCICVMELRFGSALREDFEGLWLRIHEEILSRVDILPFGAEEALTAGDALAYLQKAGRPIGIEDIFIASTALNNKCVLVTCNTRHFSNIKGLTVENWFEP
jgi:tRNA(fMet)-specific endonuclease VapC